MLRASSSYLSQMRGSVYQFGRLSRWCCIGKEKVPSSTSTKFQGVAEGKAMPPPPSPPSPPVPPPPPLTLAPPALPALPPALPPPLGATTLVCKSNGTNVLYFTESFSVPSSWLSEVGSRGDLPAQRRRRQRTRVQKDQRIAVADVLVLSPCGTAQIAAVVDEAVLESSSRINGGRCIAKAGGGATLGPQRQKLISSGRGGRCGERTANPSAAALRANALPRLLARGRGRARAMPAR